MKKLFTLVVMVAVISMTLFAQGVNTNTPAPKGLMGYHGDHDGDGIVNNLDADFIAKFKPKWANKVAVKANAKTIPHAKCPNPNGQGLGDGTKPQPRDGTGFGAQAGKRQGKNCKFNKRNGQRQGKGLRNGSCKAASVDEISGNKCGNGKGHGNRQGQCRRHRSGKSHGHGQGQCQRHRGGKCHGNRQGHCRGLSNDQCQELGKGKCPSLNQKKAVEPVVKEQ